ncbi:MAG: HAMP domain-containing histidine kinase [Lachnospiraceae bacterium]
MSGRKNILITLGFVLSVSLITPVISVILISLQYSQTQFDLLNTILGKAAVQDPKTREIISTVLKDYTAENTHNVMDVVDDTFLSSLGYLKSDFVNPISRQIILFTILGFLTGASGFILTFLYRNKAESARIQALADYLEQVNTGRAALLSTSGEDDFSKLEDEVYKTVTALYHSRDTAVQTKDKYAENLANIAHQIKTPLTAISLSLQMLRQFFADIDSFCPDSGIANKNICPSISQKSNRFYHDVRHHIKRHIKQIEKQLLRLTHLEESLLVLSRIDAGTLLLQRDEIDVFTLLVLAADNLQELFADSTVSIDIPESGEMMVTADLDWTMEAVMNLMKNCLEHNGAGTALHCSYAQNPLYTEILIWDNGTGFAKEDLPHLFERFYRGQNASEGGIGIGLALAKEIIERQNGTIRAMNKPDGGALFEIRFYIH